MRYITHLSNLKLMREDGNPAYSFKNGELIVGNQADNTAPNVIDPKPSATDGTRLQIVNPDGTSDLEKVGLGISFFESPVLSGASSITSLAVDSWYRVVVGPVTYNGVVYNFNERFKVVTGVTSATGTNISIYKDIPPAIFDGNEENFRKEFAKIHFTYQGDEMKWDEASYSVVGNFGIGSIR